MHRSYRTPRAGLILLAAPILCHPALAAAGSFQGLGDLAGGAFNSSASGVSDDGRVVVGTGATADGNQAFRWTAATGLVNLGQLGGRTQSQANAVSGDGRTFVGSAYDATFANGQGFFGTAPGALQAVPLFSDAATNSARDISRNGQFVVGSTSLNSSGRDSFRYGIAGGTLTRLAGNFQQVNASNADGSVLAGSTIATQGEQAAIYTDAGARPIGFLGTPPDGTFRILSTARALSDDGSVVVGSSINRPAGFQFDEAFVWTETAGMRALGDFAGGANESFAFDVSADGRVIVGSGNDAGGRLAAVWLDGTTLQSLGDVLAANGAGAALNGWRLTNVFAVSADGLSFVGSGINPSGQTEAFVAAIPEPASFALLAPAGLAMLRRRRA